MAQVGRISGPLLEANLERNGIDLAFRNDLDTTQLLYLNVTNNRIGVNKSTPAYDLDVNGTTRTIDLLATTAPVANFTISTNNIDVSTGNIFLDAGEAVVLTNLETSNFYITDNLIRTTSNNEDIEFRPNGTGRLSVVNNLEVYGNLHATGNITLDGTITFGDTQSQDTVTFNTDIKSDVNPTLTDTYNLGSTQKQWNKLYTNLVNGEQLTTGGALVGGIDLTKKAEYTIYVSVNGDDANAGDHVQAPLLTIQEALSRVPAGTTEPYTIYIFPGVYQEQLPLVVPKYVTISGHNIRSTQIVPAPSYEDKDVFHLSGDSTVQNLTVRDFYYNSTNNTGHAFRFAPNTTITARSPYIQNVTVITKGSTVGVDDPRGFVIGDAGRGAWIDGSEISALSFEASMLFHSCTFITPNADAITMTNGVRVEWLNSFTYFANRGLYAVNGVTGRTSQDGSTLIYGAEIRSIGSANVYGNYGAVADGSGTLMYLIQHNFGYIGSGKDSSNDKTLAIQSNETVELNSGKIYYQSTDHLGNFRVGDSFFVDLDNGNTSIDIDDLVADSLSGLVITTNGDQTVITGSKIETGNIRFSGSRIDSLIGDFNLTSATDIINLKDNTSVDGNLTIRDNFTFDGTLSIAGNESADKLTFNVELEQDFNPYQHLKFSLGTKDKQWLRANLSRLEVGDISVYDNVIESNVSNVDLELRANSTGLVKTPDSLSITNDLTVLNTTNLQSLTISGAAVINGNINLLGLFSVSDNLTVDQNLTIGAKAQFENIVVDDNFISTTVSNSNLELRANGTGDILVPLNDVIVNNNLDSKNIFVGQDFLIDNNITADTSDISTVRISENFITTNSIDADLEIRANNLGKIVTDNNVSFGQDLDIFGTTTVKDSTFAQGFGPQLVVNGTFNTNIAGWSSTGAGTTFRDPLGYIAVEAVTGARITSQNITVVPGALYQFSADIISAITYPGSPDYSLRVFESGVGDRLAWSKVNIDALGGTPRTLTGSFVAATSIVTIALRSANATVRWDNFSLIRDLGIIETITPRDIDLNGTLTQTGDRVQTGNISLTGDLTVDGRVTISDKTDFSNYTIDGNLLQNRRFGLSLKRTDTNNPLGFYNIIIAMGNGATANSYPNQTEKNLINFLANGTTVESDYAFSYADANQNGFTTLGDAIFWLQYIANGTTNDPTIDAFIKAVTDELIEIEFNNPGTFNKEVLLFGDYFEPDFVLDPNGTGKVVFSNKDVEVTNDIFAGRVISYDNINVTEEVKAEELETYNNNIVISDNFITTAVSNANLELKSTKDILINDSLTLDQDFFINGLSNLKNTVVNGAITQTGNRSSVGNLDITGNLSVRFLETTSDFKFNSISTSGNVLSSINSNENLELRANGSGKLGIFENNVRIVNDLTVLDTIASNNITVQTDVQFEEFVASSNITMFDNVITTTESNSNLELRTANSKNIILESLIFKDSTVSTVSTPIEVSINDSLDIQSNGAVLIPKGTTAQRATATSNLRFNTSNNIFEGFNNGAVISFAGIYSGNRETSVLAHPTNDTINFTIGQQPAGFVNDLGLTINGLQVDDVSFLNNRIATTVSNSDLELRTNGTGELVIDSISIVGNTIKNNFNGPLIFENQNFGVVKFASNKALVIPSGTSAERPPNPELGMARWNTEENVLEVWDGSIFNTAAGVSETISEQEFQDLMLEYTLIFG